MSDQPEPPTDAERFVAQLNRLEFVPTWTEAAGMGVQLVDLSREEFAIRDALADLEQADRGFDAIVDPALADDLDADIADHRARLEQIETRPGRYFLASGEVVQYDPVNNQAYASGWWYNEHTTRITTPHGERVHQPGIHPTASIDPRATVDPTARVEPGATIGAYTHVAAHAHIGRDARVGEHSVIQEGAWIGTNAELWSRSWIAQGALIEPHSTIGHHTTIGPGARVTQGAEIEPYSRLGAGTTTTSGRPRRGPSHRGVQIANAIENVMRLDHE